MSDGLLGKLVLIGLGAGGVILWNKFEEDKKAKANPEDEIEDRLERRIREMELRDRMLAANRYV